MSTKRYVANVAMLCPAAAREAACVRAAQLTGNPGDATLAFWSVPVYNESGEVSYYLGHARVSQVVLQLFPALQIEFPGALYILTHHDDYPEDDYLTITEWLSGLNLSIPEHEGPAGAAPDADDERF